MRKLFINLFILRLKQAHKAGPNYYFKVALFVLMAAKRGCREQSALWSSFHAFGFKKYIDKNSKQKKN